MSEANSFPNIHDMKRVGQITNAVCDWAYKEGIWPKRAKDHDKCPNIYGFTEKDLKDDR